MKVCLLASGSKGNCMYLEHKERKILIDVGISFKILKIKLKSINVDINEITDIFITHEHIDHIYGLKTYANNLKPNVYLTEETFNVLKKKLHNGVDFSIFKFIKVNENIILNDLTVEVIKTHHDAINSVGFKFSNALKSVVYITDTGYIDILEYPKLQNATMYIFESNYDTDKLFSSNRSFKLKQRIAGDLGHLSNEDSAINLASLVTKNTKYIMHAHISEECNDLELIKNTFIDIFNKYEVDYSNITFLYANQYENSEVIEL